MKSGKIKKYTIMFFVILNINSQVTAGSFVPWGLDAKRTPPMDDPPLEWFVYNTDRLGRKTYMQDYCLYVDIRKIAYACASSEEKKHAIDIAKHETQLEESKGIEKKVHDIFDELVLRKRVAEREAVEQKRIQSLPQTHIDRIYHLRDQIYRAKMTVERERRIGRSVGYVNEQTLYRAGEYIERCREEIASEYQLYRAVGGRKPLAAL
ncbi:hypothetical protein [Novosphingobium sediminicola]|uniref:Uncharacterized protein n=1 Tax=Novosphingobium sediminicola TaxID=563162 RepID=A0A7W6CJZ8_9SPHN|nr:hypothetical protein [Novosphingobium sediminicola]MBB3956865.1 hypothetical protein [Novosphingobium sediminicola]